MKCIKYSEEELFHFAYHNVQNPELLDVLIRDFGLDVNWRSKDFYDTLLYNAFKINVESANFLISKGACLNASLGGYPTGPDSHGYMSLYDAVCDWHQVDSAYLQSLGAKSFLSLPENFKEEIIKTLDTTTEARKDAFLSRSPDQFEISASTISEETAKQLKEFKNSCIECDTEIDNNDLQY